MLAVTVRFKAVGSAPILQRQICKISATQRFEGVVAYLRRVLKCGPADSVFLYVNSTFAPALDEVVGNLHKVSGLHFSHLVSVGVVMSWKERKGYDMADEILPPRPTAHQ